VYIKRASTGWVLDFMESKMKYILACPHNKPGEAISCQLNELGRKLNDSKVRKFKQEIWHDYFDAHAAEFYRYVGEDHFDDYGDAVCDLCDHDIRTVCFVERKADAPLSHYDAVLDLHVVWPDTLGLGTTCINRCGLKDTPETDVARFVQSCFKEDYCPSFRLTADGRCPAEIIMSHTKGWIAPHLILPLSIFDVDPNRWCGYYWKMRKPFDPHRKGQGLLFRSCKSINGTYRGVDKFHSIFGLPDVPLNQLYIVATANKAEQYME
jgi:hypothetical protein